MAHHLVDRRKELKRRRKRRREILKVRNKAALLSKPAPVVQPKILKETETVIPILNPVVTPPAQLSHSHETIVSGDGKTDYYAGKKFLPGQLGEIASIEELIKILPVGVKSKKIWQDVPEHFKEEIITRARQLASARSFTPPAGWDGSLRQAILEMYSNGRLPRGFGIYLGIL